MLLRNRLIPAPCDARTAKDRHGWPLDGGLASGAQALGLWPAAPLGLAQGALASLHDDVIDQVTRACCNAVPARGWLAVAPLFARGASMAHEENDGLAFAPWQGAGALHPLPAQLRY